MSGRKTALIVGASRGLGLGLVDAFLARGWDVIATVRGAQGRSALETRGDRVLVMEMDINVADDIARLRTMLSGRRLDLLFVNAGVAPDPSMPVERASTGDFLATMTTNVLSPLRVIGAFLELVSPDGTVAVMSSNMGSVGGNSGGGWEIYRASKAALNQMLKSFAARNRDGRTYICMSPGWVRTEMGGEGAPLDVETSATGIADTLLARRGTGGVHFLDYRNETIPW